MPTLTPIGLTPELSAFRRVLEAHVWGQDTSLDPERWAPSHPSSGNGALTALSVQARFGGKVVGATVTLTGDAGGTIEHYFNLINGQEVDLTRDQFPEGTHIPPGRPRPLHFGSTEAQLLASPTARARYRLLETRLQQRMGTAHTLLDTPKGAARPRGPTP